MKYVWLYDKAGRLEVLPQSTLSCTTKQLAEFHEGEVDSTRDGNRYKKLMRSDAAYRIEKYWSHYE